jgi:hypothetical protein
MSGPGLTQVTSTRWLLSSATAQERQRQSFLSAPLSRRGSDIWGAFGASRAVGAAGAGKRQFSHSTGRSPKLKSYGRATGLAWNFLSDIFLGQVASLRGETEEALRCFRRAVAPDVPPNSASGWAPSWLAWTLAQAGDQEAAGALQQAREFLPRQGRWAPFGDSFCLMHVINALAVLGRTDEAAALYPLAESMISTGMIVSFDATLPKVRQVSPQLAHRIGRARRNAIRLRYVRAMRRVIGSLNPSPVIGTPTCYWPAPQQETTRAPAPCSAKPSPCSTPLACRSMPVWPPAR